MPGIPHTYSGGHPVKVTPCQVYCTHTATVTWSRLHRARYTAHIQQRSPGQGYTVPGIPHIYSSGHPVKVTLCQVYRTHTVAVTRSRLHRTRHTAHIQWWSPGQGYTMPRIPHTYSGGHPVKVTPCQVCRTNTVAVTRSRLHRASYTAHIQRRSPGQGYTMPGIPHTYSGGHPVKVTPYQIYRTHTAAVTQSRLHHARYTSHL